MLILQDGTKFNGISIGAEGTRSGPVVIYTGVVGYQEVMTDPANAGKILVITYPLIGNYGINPKFNESKKVWCAGIVIKEKSRIYSNWQAENSFDEFLKKEGVVCLSEVDTRTLAVKIRESGEQWGTISSDEVEPYKIRSFLKEISVDKLTHAVGGKGKKIVVIDLGITNSILRQLERLNCDVWLVPYDISSGELLRLKPEGVIISNGPEEDPELDKVVDTVKGILGKMPILGVSTGHLVIARALGGKITRLKIGHRGVNYPVISPDSFKGEITVQNHGYVVDESRTFIPPRDGGSRPGRKSGDESAFGMSPHRGVPDGTTGVNPWGSIKVRDSYSIDKDIEIVERNLNDKTIEKMVSDKLKFLSIQYYPASPGFGEPNSVFSEFLHGGIHAKA